MQDCSWTKNCEESFDFCISTKKTSDRMFTGECIHSQTFFFPFFRVIQIQLDDWEPKSLSWTVTLLLMVHTRTSICGTRLHTNSLTRSHTRMHTHYYKYPHISCTRDLFVICFFKFSEHIYYWKLESTGYVWLCEIASVVRHMFDSRIKHSWQL